MEHFEFSSDGLFEESGLHGVSRGLVAQKIHAGKWGISNMPGISAPVIAIELDFGFSWRLLRTYPKELITGTQIYE